MKPRIVITGVAGICAAGKNPASIWQAVRSGRSGIGPIERWDTTGWAVRVAGEVRDADPGSLVPERKIHKLIRRTDLFGLYASARAIGDAHLIERRDALNPENARVFSERTAVYVASGGGAYEDQYDFLALLGETVGDLKAFGRELTARVNPMWLLRSLPNNVLCHIGIREGFKGPNTCFTSHGAGGVLALEEAVEALRTGRAERAVVAGHDTPVEPQRILYYDAVGLLGEDAVRPFDAARSGCLLGEGAAALVIECDAAAESRSPPALGEILGVGSVSEGEGLLPVRKDGDGVARAIAAALEDAGIEPADIGVIAAHGNGTVDGDASEAAGICRLFGPEPPPITAFKWAFGHTVAAAGLLDCAVCLCALREGEVPGIATLRTVDPALGELPVSARAQRPRSDIALVLARGFGGLNGAVVLRVAS